MGACFMFCGGGVMDIELNYLSCLQFHIDLGRCFAWLKRIGVAVSGHSVV